MNWKHSFYQIYAITFGQSFTIDESYRLLNELREDRLFSIASAFAETHRAKAKVMDAKTSLREFQNTKGVKAHARRSEAAILETEARFIIAQPCLDMARAELAFIDNCIRQIDEKAIGLRRLYDDFATGSQMVQPLEYAYDYTWSLIYEGPHSELMKNIWINPLAKEIIETADSFKDSPILERSREAVATALARCLQLPNDCLAVSVNIKNMIGAESTQMLTYTKSHDTAMIELEKKTNEQLSRPDSSSVGVASAT